MVFPLAAISTELLWRSWAGTLAKVNNLVRFGTELQYSKSALIILMAGMIYSLLQDSVVLMLSVGSSISSTHCFDGRLPQGAVYHHCQRWWAHCAFGEQPCHGEEVTCYHLHRFLRHRQLLGHYVDSKSYLPAIQLQNSVRPC